MSSSDSDGQPSKTLRARSSSSSSAHSNAENPVESRGGLVNAPHTADDSGSERSHASPTPVLKNRRLMDSSSDEEAGKKVVKSSSQGDVFGDELSSDSDNADGDVGRRRSVQDEDESNEQAFEDRSGSPMEEEPAKVKTIKGESVRVRLLYDNDLYHVRMPNFLSIETKPFVPACYEDIYVEYDAVDEEGRNRLKLKVENTLRWRVTGPETDPNYESNAKIVKWSDGTMSLMVGNEIFECQNTHLHAPMHLFIRQTHGLTGCGIFTNRIKFRPSTTESKTHKKVTMTVADRTKKSGQVRFIEEVGGINPDEAKKDIVRREEEALRAAYRRERDQTAKKRDRDRHRMSSEFLENPGFSDDESPKQGSSRRDAPLIGASSDESDDEAKRIEKSKKDASDSDEEYHRRKLEKKKKIVSSDEEDGSD